MAGILYCGPLTCLLLATPLPLAFHCKSAVSVSVILESYLVSKWKTRKAGTGTETETEIRKRSSDLKVSIVRVDGNSMQVCW